MKTGGLLTSFVLAAVLSGCGTASIDPAHVARDPERGVIVGWGSTLGDALQNAVALPSSVRVLSLYVAEADGRKWGENVVRLAPGAHNLVISCALSTGGQDPQNSRLRADLKAGRVYFLRAGSQAPGCGPYLEDVTDTLERR